MGHTKIDWYWDFWYILGTIWWDKTWLDKLMIMGLQFDMGQWYDKTSFATKRVTYKGA